MNAPTLYIRRDLALPDNDKWQNRFNVASESSNRFYVVAQHKDKKYWGCSCPAWRTRRSCKHLQAIGVPTHERPYEPVITHGGR